MQCPQRLEPLTKTGQEQYCTVHTALSLHFETQRVFAHISHNGIKIDTERLQQNCNEAQQQAEIALDFVRNSEIGQLWQKLYKTPTWHNRNELAEVLHGKRGLGLPVSDKTEHGAPDISETALRRLPISPGFGENYSYYQSLVKLKATYLEGMKPLIDPYGYIHPGFSLFGVISYRTHCQNPNFQNYPNHDKRLAKLIRSVFIPRTKERCLVEVDYSGAEVRASASINQDKNLLASVTSGLDFHKWVAAQCYALPEEEVTKALRQSVKGAFTFAAFYGSYWGSIAKGVWDEILYSNLTLKDGTPIMDHLKSKGIHGLGNLEQPEQWSYYKHIQGVEQRFWGELFKGYAQWRKDVFQDYLNTGIVEIPSGFRTSALLTRRHTYNIGAQGSAAHCLLTALCGLYNDMERYGFKNSCLVGQIHDSIVADVHKDELDNFLQLADYHMTKRVPEIHKWLKVPMEIEADVSPPGEPWLNKKEYKR